MSGFKIDERLAAYVAAVEQELARRARSRYWGRVSSLSGQVRQALLAVPRHRLLTGFYRWEGGRPIWVPLDPHAPTDEDLKEIYANTPVVIKVSPDGFPLSSSSEPVLVVSMLELLELEPGMNILEIGAGTGYNAALLAEIIGDPEGVTTLEIQADIAERTRHLLLHAGYGSIRLHCADGFFGWGGGAPYDRIVATTCCSDISPHWLDQLGEEGWMLVPLMHGGKGTAPLVRVFADGSGEVLSLAGFGPAMGALGGPGPWGEASLPRSFPSAQELAGRKLTQVAGDDWDLDLFLLHFHYFLALNESNACLFWKSGVRQVLCDDEVMAGAFLLCGPDGEIKVAGNEELCRRVEENYKEYEEFGQPLVEDYRMKFSVRPSPLEATGAVGRVRRVGLREWVIERRFTVQRVWLPG